MIARSESMLDHDLTTSLAAFLGGLGLIYFLGWNTGDLVWSLWLASLCVGWLIILRVTLGASLLGESMLSGLSVKGLETQATGPLAAAPGVITAVFMLVFFTLHFGFFHFVHSGFLSVFFPVFPGQQSETFFDPRMYSEVVARYWPFVVVTALAEWRAMVFKPERCNPISYPYRNVVRLHLLIFFFAGVSAAGLENFFVYAIVYACYFFPFDRLVRSLRGSAES